MFTTLHADFADEWAKDAVHIYQEKSSSVMMQLWPLQSNKQ
jgi:hypothetical protein